MLIVARTKLVDDLDTADNPGEVEELRKVRGMVRKAFNCYHGSGRRGHCLKCGWAESNEGAKGI